MTDFEDILHEMAGMLDANDEPDWALSMRNMEALSLAGNTAEAMKCIRDTYAGMGSLNDLVLHRDGVPTRDNERFDALRAKLYAVVTGVRA